MGKKLYVGNLPFSVTDEVLQSKFAEVGTVESAKIISDKFSGRSKGFGFVEMSSEEEAQAAITRFHGSDYEGRAMTVSEARPETPRTGGGGGFRGGRNDRGGFGGNRKSW